MAKKVTTKSKKPVGFKGRIDTAIKEEMKIYSKHKLARKLVVNFPKSKRVPFLGKLGMRLITISGGVLDIQFFDMNKKN